MIMPLGGQACCCMLVACCVVGMKGMAVPNDA
jgi:hypothetical protein